MARDAPSWSSLEARVATSRVAAAPTPRSARENQPDMAEKVLSSTQVPKAAVPSPWRVRGRVTTLMMMAHRLPAPTAPVLASRRRRKG